jgi:hypothetical protein
MPAIDCVERDGDEEPPPSPPPPPQAIIAMLNMIITDEAARSVDFFICLSVFALGFSSMLRKFLIAEKDHGMTNLCSPVSSGGGERQPH